jgi:hypothetical protein
MPESIGPCFVCGKPIAFGESWAADPQFNKVCFGCWNEKYCAKEDISAARPLQLGNFQGKANPELPVSNGGANLPPLPSLRDFRAPAALDQAADPVAARVLLVLAVLVWIPLLGNTSWLRLITVLIGVFAAADSFTRNRGNTVIAAFIFICLCIIQALVALGGLGGTGNHASDFIIVFFLCGGISALLTLGAMWCLRAK